MADDQDRDGRHALARGYVLASRVSSIGLQMVVPLGLGWWADSAWKTTPWCMILGAVLGFVIAMLQLIHLARESASSEEGHSSSGGKANTDGQGGGP